MEENFTLDTLREEVNQTPARRQRLLRKLGEALGRTVVTYFTSHKYPVVIDGSDADMLEEVLRATDLKNGLCLLLDTPGGDTMAAERIVRICRVYSKNKFDVFVMRIAKSAGTIIAMGADKIYMGETSALGRIDPQLVTKHPDGTQLLMPAHAVLLSFDDLVKKATSSEGCAEAYLQQLRNYDTKEIELLRRTLIMTEDIAVRCLKQGMMAEMSEKVIKKNIAIFTTPIVTKAHARDIYFDEAQKAGLKVELVRHDNPIWDIASELYVRASYFVSSEYCKLIESPEHHFSLPPPQ